MFHPFLISPARSASDPLAHVGLLFTVLHNPAVLLNSIPRRDFSFISASRWPQGTGGPVPVGGAGSPV